MKFAEKLFESNPCGIRLRHYLSLVFITTLIKSS